MTDVYGRIYEKLEKIGILSVRQYAVIENPPNVPLCVDRLSNDRYAIAHNPLVDGVMVADPDMEIRVFSEKRTAEPLTFQDRSGRRVVYKEAGKVDLKVRNDLTAFLESWLTKLVNEGYRR